MTWPKEPFTPIPFALTNLSAFFALRGISPLMTSAVWASANQAVYTPVIVNKPFAVRQFSIYHGAAVSGNKDLGIYLPDAEGKPGAAIWRLGSAAMASTSIVVSHLISPTVYIPRGLIYLAAAFDNTTAQVTRMYAQGTDGENIFTGVFSQAAAFPLPATATPSKAFVAAAVPILGIEGL